MNKLEILFQELVSKITHQNSMNAAVSQASVGWHIEHILLVTNSIIKVMKKSDPDTYQWSFNFKRILVFVMGKIPRGKAKAPKAVTPTAVFDEETLRKHLAQTIENLSSLNGLKANAYFEHPYFGKLNLKPAIKFINIHTKHHFDIINDIIKS